MIYQAMSRQLILRPTRPGIYLGAFHRLPITCRHMTTTPQLSQEQPGTDKAPPPHSEGSNTLIILSALGALGGLYYYYTRGKPGVDRENERHLEEEARRRVREIGDTSKDKMENVVAQGQRDYNKAKTTVQGATSTARTRATEAGTDLVERARQSAHDAHVKLDELKGTAERKMGDVRDRSEKRFEEEKEEVAQQAREAGNKARGWFGWGSSK